MPVTLQEGGATLLKGSDFACCIYEDKDEWGRTLAAYIKRGFIANERVLCLLDTHDIAELMVYLRTEDVDADQEMRSGRLILKKISDISMPLRRDFSALLAALKDETEKAVNQGYASLRLSYEVGDFLLKDPGFHNLRYWEAGLSSRFFPSHPALGLAFYDYRMSPELLKGVLSTHRLIVWKGNLFKNKYADASQMLSEESSRALIDSWLTRLAEEQAAAQSRKQNRRELKQIAEVVLDSLVSGLIILDHEGRVLICNRAAETIFGFSRDEIKGRELHRLVTPGHLIKNYEDGFNHFTKTGEGRLLGTTVEVTARRKDGSEFLAEVTISPVKIRGTWSAVGIVRDITERKTVEKALKESEQRFRTLVQSMDDIVFTIDKNGYLTGIYGNWLERTGINIENRLGHHIKDLLGIHYPLHAEASQRALAGEPVKYEWRLMVNGKGRFLEISLSPLRDGEGQVTGLVGVGRDITASKNTERQLMEQLNLLQQIMDAIPTPTFYRDTSGIYRGCNKALEEALGLSRSQIIGHHISEVMPPDLAEEYLEADLEVMAKSQVKCYEWEFQYADGIRHTVLVNKAPFYNLGRQVQGVVGVVVDMTERKKMELDLMRLDRLRVVGEMAAGIAHEIRNPMTTVRGFLQVLMADDNLADYREYFTMMIEELDSANAIIGEFLSLAKDNALNLKNHSLNSVISAVIPLLTAEAIKGDKSVIFLPGIVGDLLLDARQIRQLVINLGKNGLEAMGPGGVLTIETYDEGSEVVMAVRDQGPGIDPETLKKLGTPFFTTKEQGTGMGLVICFSIAARHQAKINVETGPKGTTFFVRFPSFRAKGSLSA